MLAQFPQIECVADVFGDSMVKPTDDFDAVRAVITALEGFPADEQERILRWAREKLKLPLSSPQTSIPALVSPAALPPSLSSSSGPGSSGQIKNLNSFVQEKNPRNDVQFAATAAYFYRFEAPESEKKLEINQTDLQDAARLANWTRFKHPGQTLRNAVNLGLLNRGSADGQFTINSVGENLVAMALPSGSSTKSKKARKSTSGRKRSAQKKPKK